jgi:hypothetical protein
MTLRGTAFLAIWNDIEEGFDDEFNEWHTIEHMPERLYTPGITVGRRYEDPDAKVGRYYTMYEADSFEVFASDGYYATGNAPSEWTMQVHKKFRNFSRAPCYTVMSRGRGFGGALATARITYPVGDKREGEDAIPRYDVLNATTRRVTDKLMALSGVTGVHTGRAATVNRRSLRKDSLNNRSDTIKFDAVILIEGISRAHLTKLAGAISEIVSSETDCVASHTLGVYDLAYILGRVES